MEQLKSEIRRTVEVLSAPNLAVTPQAKHEYQEHLRGLLQIMREAIKSSLVEKLPF